MKTLAYEHADVERCFGTPEEPVSYIFTDSIDEAKEAVNELVAIVSKNYPDCAVTLKKLIANSKSDFLKKLVKRSADLVGIEESEYDDYWFNKSDILYETKIMSRHNHSYFTEVKPIYFLKLPPINNNYSRGVGLTPHYKCIKNLKTPEIKPMKMRFIPDNDVGFQTNQYDF